MTRTRPCQIWAAFTLAATSFIAADSAAAQHDWRTELLLGGAWVDPRPSLHLPAAGDPATEINLGDTIGLFAGIRHHLHPRVSIEPGLTITRPEIVVRANVDGERVRVTDHFSTTMLTAALNLHLLSNSRVDLYAGPAVGWIAYGDLEFALDDGTTASFRSESDFAWGVQTGVTVPLGDGRWALNAAVRYLDTTLEVRDVDGERTRIDLDPLLLQFGISIRF